MVNKPVRCGQKWEVARCFRIFTKSCCPKVDRLDKLVVIRDEDEDLFVNGNWVKVRRVLWQSNEAFVLANRFDGESLYHIG